MKINKTLSLTAIIYLLINILFYLHATSLNGGASMGYVVIFPAFWIITLITVIILCIKNRKTWFRKQLLLSTLISIFLYTPISIALFTLISAPSTYLAGSGGNGADNKTFEEWAMLLTINLQQQNIGKILRKMDYGLISTSKETLLKQSFTETIV